MMSVLLCLNLSDSCCIAVVFLLCLKLSEYSYTAAESETLNFSILYKSAICCCCIAVVFAVFSTVKDFCYCIL